jgi:hypothetical protein
MLPKRCGGGQFSDSNLGATNKAPAALERLPGVNIDCLTDNRLLVFYKSQDSVQFFRTDVK